MSDQAKQAITDPYALPHGFNAPNGIGAPGAVIYWATVSNVAPASTGTAPYSLQGGGFV